MAHSETYTKPDGNVVRARNGVQSIEIGFSILQTLAQSRKALALKDISSRTGLSPSKLHSYLTSFTATGLVEKHQDINSYALGPATIQLGLSYLDHHDLYSAAKQTMLEVAEELGQTVFLGVWGNRGPTIIQRVDGLYSQTIFELRVGSVLPILNSALGRNFGAHLPFSIIEPFLQRELENQNRSSTIDSETPSNIKGIKRMFAETREHGISRCRNGVITGFTAMSAPIFDFSNTISAGLTVMARINQIDDELDGETAQILKEASAKISSNPK